MPDPQDMVELRHAAYGARRADGGEPSSSPALGPRSKWLSIWFQCCHVYGRMNRNSEGTRYEGRCPACGARVHALVGEGGTNQRLFRAT